MSMIVTPLTLLMFPVSEENAVEIKVHASLNAEEVNVVINFLKVYKKQVQEVKSANS